METIKFRITGRAPGLLMHNPASMRGATDKPHVKQIPTPEVEAEAAAYKLESGQLYAKADWFRESLKGGAKGHRIGKIGAPGILASTIFPTNDILPLSDPDTGKPITEYVIDSRRAVVQHQGIVRNRPLIARWACEVEFDSVGAGMGGVSPEAVEEFLTKAGLLVGVGDYRPQQGGPFGRYEVEQVDAD
ncbi:hypothetical protein LCGC14_0644290 [marine sediment metagenome]|uniref:Uncharacterized protein n=1 Tax=marine sediment metagenome TaxID=412755 RepID=A0A0F9QYI5_9ZZZZ